MKKRTLPIVLIAFFLVSRADAQIAKGSVWLGGSLQFYSQKTTDPTG